MTNLEKAIVMAYTGYAMLTGDRLEVFYNYIEGKMGYRLLTREFAYPEIQEEIHRASYEDFIKLCEDDDDWEAKPEIEPGKFLGFYHGSQRDAQVVFLKRKEENDGK